MSTQGSDASNTRDDDAPTENQSGNGHPDVESTRGASAEDPVNRWATEHYGFSDEPLVPAGIAAPTAAAATRPGPRRRTVRVAAGVLALVLTGGVGIAAAATEGGPGGGRGDGVVQVRFDGIQDGGHDGGGRGGGPR